MTRDLLGGQRAQFGAVSCRNSLACTSAFCVHPAFMAAVSMTADSNTRSLRSCRSDAPTFPLSRPQGHSPHTQRRSAFPNHRATSNTRAACAWPHTPTPAIDRVYSRARPLTPLPPVRHQLRLSFCCSLGTTPHNRREGPATRRRPGSWNNPGRPHGRTPTSSSTHRARRPSSAQSRSSRERQTSS